MQSSSNKYIPSKSKGKWSKYFLGNTPSVKKQEHYKFVSYVVIYECLHNNSLSLYVYDTLINVYGQASRWIGSSFPIIKSKQTFSVVCSMKM